MDKYKTVNGRQYVKYSYLVKNRGECIDYIAQGKWKTKCQIIYWIDYMFKNEYIIIPKGYEFDFNSVPCWGTCIVGKDEFMIALVHDVLYGKTGKINIISTHALSPKFQGLQTGFGFDNETGEYLYDRKMADAIWLDGAIEEKIKIERTDVSRRATLGYMAIRIGGAKTFRKGI